MSNWGVCPLAVIVAGAAPVPDADTVSVFGPSATLQPTVASPTLSVICETLVTLPPALGAKSSATPESGMPVLSSTRTTGGMLSAYFASPTWLSPATITTAAGGPDTTARAVNTWLRPA